MKHKTKEEIGQTLRDLIEHKCIRPIQDHIDPKNEHDQGAQWDNRTMHWFDDKVEEFATLLFDTQINILKDMKESEDEKKEEKKMPSVAFESEDGLAVFCVDGSYSAGEFVALDVSKFTPKDWEDIECETDNDRIYTALRIYKKRNKKK